MSTYQLVNLSTYQHVTQVSHILNNLSTCQHVNMLIYQHVNMSTSQHVNMLTQESHIALTCTGAHDVAEHGVADNAKEEDHNVEEY